jgi:hypothetical protein
MTYSMQRTVIAFAVGLVVSIGMDSFSHAESPTERGLPHPTAVPAELSAFIDGVGRDVATRLACPDKHWRQIAPAVHHLARQHADVLAALDDDDRLTALVSLAGFIDAKRKAVRDVPVLAPGRTVLGLLDPDRGLGPKEITAISDAYGCESMIFKKDGDGETLDGVAANFLSAMTAAVKSGKPTTVIVLGHGLPTEIQSYHIRFERLAKALLDGVPQETAADLSQVVLICDDCFSADFSINLLNEIAAESRRRSLRLESLPICIAGTNRDRVGYVDVGEKFVPHFWRDVIELSFIRRSKQKAVTLGDFFEKVDNMMYGYGRAPIVEDGRVTGYRLIDRNLVQDPVVFVPLDAADCVNLREILGLSADAPLPLWLDIG